ncbi:MAG: DsbA family protein [Pseudomonadota bacterium]|nr:DsbA family protein [Pseudomonadota bacterium]
MKNLNYHLIIFLFSFFLVYEESFSDVMEQKIKDFILQNPEVIIESLKNFDKKEENKLILQNSQRIKDYKDQIFNSKTDLYDGNVIGDKVIVEFFDYNCSYCKRVHKDLERVLKNFDNVKIIYKNFPILTERSVLLAKYSIIISEINNKKFTDFHSLIINNKGEVSESYLEEIFKKLDLKKEDLNKRLEDKRIKEKLRLDIDLAKKLGLRGTPAFVIGDEIIFGYIGYNDFLSKLEINKINN